MFDVRVLNIAIELWGAAFSLVAIVCVAYFTTFQRQYRRTFVTMFVMEFIAASGDAIAGIYRGEAGSLAWLATHLGNLSTFVASLLLVAATSSYVVMRLGELGDSARRPWLVGVKVMAVVMCVCAALGTFYHIDESNIYHRNDLYWVAQTYAIAVNGINAILILNNARRLNRSALACLLFYSFLPAALSFVQIFVYGLNFAIVAGVLGLLVLFLEMQSHVADELVMRSEQLARAKVDISESRLNDVISQLQPRFLLESLDAIHDVAQDDRTKDALSSYARYLQTNLLSLRETEPVPITVEMDHVRTCLELVGLSDGGLASFALQMPVEGFRVPLLSVQAMVELVVAYGLGHTGGNVTVCTGEARKEYWVSIVGSGTGCKRLNDLPDEARLAVQNTRARLEAFCGGTLEVDDERASGAMVLIHIPKA